MGLKPHFREEGTEAQKLLNNFLTSHSWKELEQVFISKPAWIQSPYLSLCSAKLHVFYVFSLYHLSE